MRLLLDQGLSRLAVPLLQQAGYDAIHVAQCGLDSASDESILEYARDTKRCVITLDADFHAILARTRAASPSVIRIRVQKLRARAQFAIVSLAITLCADELEQGAVATITIDRVRVRLLPLP